MVAIPVRNRSPFRRSGGIPGWLPGQAQSVRVHDLSREIGRRRHRWCQRLGRQRFTWRGSSAAPPHTRRYRPPHTQLAPAKPAARSARALGRARQGSRVRCRHFPRLLVPRPHRHPCPRVREREQGHVLRRRRADGWARRGLQGGQPEQRVEAGGCPMRRTTRTWCSRNFSEYEDSRKQQLGDAATRPHRITYRNLTR